MRSRHSTIYYVCLVVISVSVVVSAMRDPGWTLLGRTSVGTLVRGEAEMPFARRALLPLVARGIMLLVPASVDARIDRSVAPRINGPVGDTHVEPDAVTEFFVLFVLQVLTLCAAGVAVRALSASVYRAPWRFHNGVSLITVSLLPTFFVHMAPVYDYATLFFFTIGALLLLRHRWSLFAVVVAIACLNKETAFLLPLLFALYTWRTAALLPRHIVAAFAVGGAA